MSKLHAGRKRRRWWRLLGIALALAGCASQTTPGTPPFATPTQPRAGGSAAIRPTATPLPQIGKPQPGTSATIDLAPILAQPDDLPAGFIMKPTQGANRAFDLQVRTDGADDTLTQPFSNIGSPGVTRANAMFGYATLWFYADTAPLPRVHEHATSYLGLTPQPAGTLGEQSSIRITDSPNDKSMQLMYFRCHALVYVYMLGSDAIDAEAGQAWAQKIDQRIQTSPLCAKQVLPGPTGRSPHAPGSGT